ncbi:MAG: IS110 family transposase [Verrucomicrobiae bacterium]|nr:IS110 family transposase [Verrucomicrobiae bacterium]MCW5554337.1 IS110 family transposase [Verrucomicrobiae bacterium]
MKNPLDLPILNPHAAGVDVGSEKFFASVGGQEPKVFLTVTAQMRELCRYFQAQGVCTVALEATGVYWINLYGALEEAGMEVLVVNGAHCRNFPGRKTDMKDCQWLAVLHAHGLLTSGFVPPGDIRRLRDYLRLRDDLVSMAAQHVQHLQKALDRLNVKLHVVISDITGVSGLKIIKAILAGERTPEKLIELCDAQILKTKRAAVLESLRGLWRKEPLFGLELALESYESYQKQIARCDERIAEVIGQLRGGKPTPELGPKTELRHNAMIMDDLQRSLAQIYGKDLTQLPCLNQSTVTMLLAEIGQDMSRWKDWRHFGSWMAVAPSSAQSGKRRRREKRYLNRAGRILCRAVQCMAVGKHTWLASFYRRIRAKRGAKVAITAAAYKLAKLIYLVLTQGWEYVEAGIAKYQARVRQQQLKALQKLARELDFVLLPKALATN